MGLSKGGCAGIDAVINELQRDLFLELTAKFGWRDYQSYYRVNRNRKGSDLIPEIYTGNGNYREVLFDDKCAVSSFFLVDLSRTYDPKKFVWAQDMSMIFQANLEKLFPDIKDYRPDEEMIDNIRLAIKKKFWGPRLKAVYTGIDKCYEGLKISGDRKYMDDMGKFAVCRFDFGMIYTDTIKTQPIK